MRLHNNKTTFVNFALCTTCFTCAAANGPEQSQWHTYGIRSLEPDNHQHDPSDRNNSIPTHSKNLINAGEDDGSQSHSCEVNFLESKWIPLESKVNWQSERMRPRSPRQSNYEADFEEKRSSDAIGSIGNDRSSTITAPCGGSREASKLEQQQKQEQVGTHESKQEPKNLPLLVLVPMPPSFMDKHDIVGKLHEHQLGKLANETKEPVIPRDKKIVPPTEIQNTTPQEQSPTMGKYKNKNSYNHDDHIKSQIESNGSKKADKPTNIFRRMMASIKKKKRDHVPATRQETLDSFAEYEEMFDEEEQEENNERNSSRPIESSEISLEVTETQRKNLSQLWDEPETDHTLHGERVLHG